MFFPPQNRCRFPYFDRRYSQQCDETRSTANLYSPGGCLANEACFAARLTLTFVLKDVGDGRLSKVVHTDANAIQQSIDFRRPLPESMIRSRRLNRARKQCFDNTRMMARQGFHGYSTSLAEAWQNFTAKVRLCAIYVWLTFRLSLDFR